MVISKKNHMPVVDGGLTDDLNYGNARGFRPLAKEEADALAIVSSTDTFGDRWAYVDIN
jgi:hypothetical protein